LILTIDFDGVLSLSAIYLVNLVVAECEGDLVVCFVKFKLVDYIMLHMNNIFLNQVLWMSLF
jgi:hypothetical protein